MRISKRTALIAAGIVLAAGGGAAAVVAQADDPLDEATSTSTPTVTVTDTVSTTPTPTATASTSSSAGSTPRPPKPSHSEPAETMTLTGVVLVRQDGVLTPAAGAKADFNGEPRDAVLDAEGRFTLEGITDLEVNGIIIFDIPGHPGVSQCLYTEGEGEGIGCTEHYFTPGFNDLGTFIIDVP